MKLRSRLVSASVFTALLALGVAFGAPGSQGATVTAQAVAGKVSVLFGQGGNIGVSVGPDGLLMIDDQFERLVPEIEAALAKLAGSPEKGRPRFLVNTHHHGDHTGGNAHFGALATVVAHANVRKRLAEPATAPAALPVVTFEDGLSLHVNGEEVRVLHVAEGHTDGDSVVWFTGSNVVHLGDLYFQVGYPFVDVASGGNVLGLIEGLSGLLESLPDDVRIIPGHGAVTGKDELAEYVHMLETITERVRARLEKGEDAKAMVAAGVTRDFDERWGKFDFVPPENFVGSVIASLR